MRSNRLGWRARATTRMLALGMALSAIAGMRPAFASPGDIFTIPAPAVGSDPPKATPLQDGDASVSQTGAMQYGYPIAVPPGRNGMQPRLSLSYSSQGPIYGTLAAGWSLSGLPIITLDTSQGRMVAAANGTKTYQSSMAGGRYLVQVEEPTDNDTTAFRAQNDDTFTRYEKGNSDRPFRWKALTSDGMTYFFGEPAHIAGTPDNPSSPCSIVSDEYAPLTSQMDSFGNTVNYYYSIGALTSECRIQKITWGENANIGTVYPGFASVSFSYGNPKVHLCSNAPVGSLTSYRTGTPITTGASELDSITVTAYAPGSSTADHTRTYGLTYDSGAASCSAQHAAFRQLDAINETAVGTNSPSVSLPAVTFGYGSATLTYPDQQHTTPLSPGWVVPLTGLTANLATGMRYDPNATEAFQKWPTVEAMMIDVDGDGLLDRVTSVPTTVGGVLECGAKWQRNEGYVNGLLTFAPGIPISLPTLKWADTLGSYNGGTQPNSHTTQPYMKPTPEGCSLNYQVTWYQNSNPNMTGECNPNFASCTAGSVCSDQDDCVTTASNPKPTYLAYRWVDIDGDGLLDIVASVAQGSPNFYNLHQGVGVTGGSAPAEPAIFGSFPSCPGTQPGGAVGGVYTMCGGWYPWFVYKNLGYGTFGSTPQIIYQPVPLETDTGDSSLTASPIGQTQGVLDLDGDGLPDGVGTGSFAWGVNANNGSGQFVRPVGSLGYSFPSGSGDQLSAIQCPNPSVPT